MSVRGSVSCVGQRFAFTVGRACAMGGRKDQNWRSLFQSIPSATPVCPGSSADNTPNAMLPTTPAKVASSNEQNTRHLITLDSDCRPDYFAQTYAEAGADASEMAGAEERARIEINPEPGSGAPHLDTTPRSAGGPRPQHVARSRWSGEFQSLYTG